MKTFKRKIFKSFLFACLGLTIATIAFANVKMFLDRPSPPGRPEAMNIWSSHCGLRYLPPLDDGGLQVTDYIIEGSEIDQNIWVPKGTSQTLSHTVSGFTKGSTHEFRVYAQNAVGLSDPSGESNPVTFKDPYNN